MRQKMCKITDHLAGRSCLETDTILCRCRHWSVYHMTVTLGGPVFFGGVHRTHPAVHDNLHNVNNSPSYHYLRHLHCRP